MEDIINVSVTEPSTTTYGCTGTNIYWGAPTIIYMYQITCPKRACKKTNWMQLNIITPCSKCGAKLKAVSEQADFFEIPVGK